MCTVSSTCTTHNPVVWNIKYKYLKRSLRTNIKQKGTQDLINKTNNVVVSSGSYQSLPSASPKIVSCLTRKRWVKETASPYRAVVSKSYCSKTTYSYSGEKTSMLFQKSVLLKAEVMDGCWFSNIWDCRCFSIVILVTLLLICWCKTATLYLSSSPKCTFFICSLEKATFLLDHVLS